MIGELVPSPPDVASGFGQAGALPVRGVGGFGRRRGCLCPAPLAAQTATLRFRHLGTDQGLSQSAVMAILQDRRGFVWLGTQDGLDRYDGVEFLHLRHHPAEGPAGPASPASLSSNYVPRPRRGPRRPAVDRHRHHRARPLRPGQPASCATSATRRASPTACPATRCGPWRFDAGGWLWVATGDCGLAHLDPATGRAIRYRHDPADPDSLRDDHLTSLLVDQAGRLWIGTRRGLDCFEPQAGKFLHGSLLGAERGEFGEAPVRALHQDSRGRMWIGTHAGLDLFDPARGSLRHFAPEPGNPYALSNPPVRALIEDSFGRLWVGTDQGIHILDEEKGTLRAPPPRLLARRQPLAGRGDHLLPRPRRPRVGRHPGRQRQHLGSGQPLFRPRREPPRRDRQPSPPITSRPSPSSATPALRRHPRRRPRRARPRHRPLHRLPPGQRSRSGTGRLADDRVMSLAADPGGRLWLGTFGGGLQRFDPRSRRFERWLNRRDDPRSVASDASATLLVDRRGRLWIGSFGGGLDRFEERGGEFVHYRFAEGNPASLPSDVVTALAEAPEGGLFVGTDGGGVAYLAADDRRLVRLLAREGDLQGLDVVRSLYAAPGGALWVGTADAGLVLVDAFDPGQRPGRDPPFRRPGQRAGRHRLGHPAGFRRPALAVDQPRPRPVRPGPPRLPRLRARYGLQGEEFNYGAHFRSARGELFFGGNHGYNALFPRAAAGHRAAARGGDHPGPPNATPSCGPSRWPATRRRSSSTTTTACCRSSSPPSISRRPTKTASASGSKVSTKAGPRPPRAGMATFTNLDPGNYTLRVIAANADGMWSSHAASLAVRVLPAPWETWWAILLYFVAAAGLIGSGIRWRLAGLERARARAAAAGRSAHRRAVAHRASSCGSPSSRRSTPRCGPCGPSKTRSRSGARRRRRAAPKAPSCRTSATSCAPRSTRCSASPS